MKVSISIDHGALTQPIRRYARPLAEVPVVAPHEPALRIVGARQVAISPVLALVVDEGDPVGIVTRSGIAAALERAELMGSSRPEHL